MAVDDGYRCPTCGTPATSPTRFCGRCGDLLPDRPDAASDGDPTEVAAAAAHEVPLPDDGPRRALPRRTLLVGASLLLIGGGAGAVLSRLLEPRAVFDDHGLPTAEFVVGDARELADRIATDGPVHVPDEGGRLAIVRWDPSYGSGTSARALDRYGPDGEGHPVLDDATGLLVLSLVSTHLGCGVIHCPSSRWFEDPCGGSLWNAWGEYVGGPAPRGLDRFTSRIGDDGGLVIDLTRTMGGPHRQSTLLGEPPAGPHCTDV